MGGDEFVEVAIHWMSRIALEVASSWLSGITEILSSGLSG